MNELALLKRYWKEVDPQILAQYKNPERSIWVNTDDKDLIPIEIKLPEPPEPHLIDGWGLPAREQMWHPPKLPKRLKELSKFATLDEIWEELNAHQDIYEDEINFIIDQWDKRLNGHWFYNNGVPTYIDGWHHFYLSWWHIDTGLPKYRDRDRRFFLFARKCYTETIAPKCDPKTGQAIFDKHGNCEWVDYGRRVLFGFNYPKHRREGATYKAECIHYEIISRTLNAFGGIQSMTDIKSKECFLRHLVAPWKKLPFFFKPNYEGSTSPKTELSFSPPAKRIAGKGALASADMGLESGINFEMADPSAYDGHKLYFHHDDEVGKLKKGLSCWSRHMVVKECLVMGSDIVGFTIKTSTVGEMEKGGGRAFKHQCSQSKYYERNPNGQTISGLATLFIPAYDGLEGFIDQYGMSVIDTPTKEQAAFIGKKIGAREYLLNNRKGYIDSGDQESLSETIRLYPIRFTECFRTAAKSSGFNMNKLEAYIDDLRMAKQEIAIGNFMWQDGVRDTRVVFVANPNGKFKVSHQLNDNESNLRFKNDDDEWQPGNAHWGVAGGDPFKFNKTEGNRKSKGGGAVIKKGQLMTVDGVFRMVRKFACVYAQRTFDKDIYGEDMLMMCLYYGVPMFPEIDYPFLWDYFDGRGYGGFLLYKVDPKTMKINNTPGDTANKVKQEIFTEYMTWIENEARFENHIEVLEECRDIEGPEDMTNYDLFTAGGYALLGTRGIYDEIAKLDEKSCDLSEFYQTHTISSR